MTHDPSAAVPTGEEVSGDLRGFRCGEITVVPSLNLIRTAEGEVRLGSVVMTLLVALARRSGRLASKETLVREVWGGRSVSDDALTVAIYELRKALGDRARAPRFVETIPGRGYRWLPDVEWEASAAGSSVAARPPEIPADFQPEVTAGPPGESVGRGFGGPRARVVASLLLIAVAAWGVLGGASRQRTPAPLALVPGSTVAILSLVPLAPEGQTGDLTFARGMTDTLILALARSSPIRVLSHAPVAVDAESAELPEIAERLGADLLIGGWALRDGEEVELRVWLAEGRSGARLWEGTFGGEARKVLDTQVEVADALVREIREHLVDEAASLRERPPMPAAGPLPLAALDAYLLGLEGLRHGTAESLERGLSALRLAIELAPRHALIWARLSQLHTVRFEMGLGHFPEEMELARSTAEQALTLDPDSPEALHSLGLYQLVVDLDLAFAEASLRRSLASDPTASASWQTLTWVLMAQHRPEEAVAAGRRSLAAEPGSETAALALGVALWMSGDPEGAVEVFDTHRREGTLFGLLIFKNWFYLLLSEGRPEEAWELLREELTQPDRRAAFERAWAEGGLLAVLDRRRMELESAGDVGFGLAVHHLWTENPEAALDELEGMIRRGDPDLVIANFHPALRPLHGHPRFDGLLRPIGFPTAGR